MLESRTIARAILLLASSLAGCASLSPASTAEAVNLAARAAEAGGRELARSMSEASARDASQGGSRALEGRGEGDRLFLCWLDASGGEELWADDVHGATERCHALHGRRDEPRHCRCEAQ